MRRRGFLLGSSVVLGAVTAGCADVLGDGPLRFEAGQAYVPESVVQETGYEEVERTALVIEREFEVGDQSRSVEVVNWLTQYGKGFDEGPAADEQTAVFGAVTTPQVEVLGRTFNPVAEYSPEEVAGMVEDQYEEIRRLEAGRESTVTILGEETTETRFNGELKLKSGATIDGYVHVSEPVERGEDFVITLGGYPRQLADEEATVRTMMEAVEYESGSDG